VSEHEDRRAAYLPSPLPIGRLRAETLVNVALAGEAPMRTGPWRALGEDSARLLRILSGEDLARAEARRLARAAVAPPVEAGGHRLEEAELEPARSVASARPSPPPPPAPGRRASTRSSDPDVAPPPPAQVPTAVPASRPPPAPLPAPPMPVAAPEPAVAATVATRPAVAGSVPTVTSQGQPVTRGARAADPVAEHAHPPTDDIGNGEGPPSPDTSVPTGDGAADTDPSAERPAPRAAPGLRPIATPRRQRPRRTPLRRRFAREWSRATGVPHEVDETGTGDTPSSNGHGRQAPPAPEPAEPAATASAPRGSPSDTSRPDPEAAAPPSTSVEVPIDASVTGPAVHATDEAGRTNPDATDDAGRQDPDGTDEPAGTDEPGQAAESDGTEDRWEDLFGARAGSVQAARPDPRPQEPAPRPAPSAVLAAEASGVSPTATLPHDCVEDPALELRPSKRTSSRRLIGIDAARGVAMLAMIVLHILPPAADDGTMSLPWRLSAWNASALFALVAGIAIALSNGRTVPPQGPAWAASASGLAVRAVVIGAMGLALGMLVPIERAAVILPYYAVLFLLAIPLLRLPVRRLLPLTIGLALVVPLLSYATRSLLPEALLVGAGEANLVLTDVRDAPVQLVVELLLTGVYPALTYLVYLCAGLTIGRLRLDLRWVAVTLTGVGAAMAAAASATTWLLLERFGGEVALQSAALRTMTFAEYTDLRIYGADGEVPTTSLWWLAILTPHSGTTPTLLFMIGVGMAIVGSMLLISRVAASLLLPFVVLGSMTLTLYTLHLLLLSAPFITIRDASEFWLHLAVLLAFAWVWRLWSVRGPLEQVLTWSTRGTRRFSEQVVTRAREPVTTSG
jgi:uncharacterized membrane protein